MKAIHLAGIPCKTVEVGGLTYTHLHKLVTCKKCKDIINGVPEKAEPIKTVKDDKRRAKRKVTE